MWRLLRCTLAVLSICLAVLNPYVLPSGLVYAGVAASVMAVVVLCIDSGVRCRGGPLGLLLVLLAVTALEGFMLMLRLRGPYTSPSVRLFHALVRCGFVFRTILLAHYVLELLPSPPVFGGMCRRCRRCYRALRSCCGCAGSAGTPLTTVRSRSSEIGAGAVLGPAPANGGVSAVWALVALFLAPAVLPQGGANPRPIFELVERNSSITMQDLTPLEPRLLSVSAADRPLPGSAASPEGRPLFAVECAIHRTVTVCLAAPAQAVGECCSLLLFALCVVGVLWRTGGRYITLSKPSRAASPAVFPATDTLSNTRDRLRGRFGSRSATADPGTSSQPRSMYGHAHSLLDLLPSAVKQMRPLQIPAGDHTFSTQHSVTQGSPGLPTPPSAADVSSGSPARIMPFFLQKLSHELRTPVAATVMSLDALRTTALSRSQLELVNQAASSAETALQHTGAIAAVGDLFVLTTVQRGWFDVQVCSAAVA